MSSTNDGGQAFPHISRWTQEFTDDGKCVGCYPTGGGLGMSLRDYFAAKAMAAMLASGSFTCVVADSGRPLTQHEMIPIAGGSGGALNAEHISGEAYAYADAMLAAREAKS